MLFAYSKGITSSREIQWCCETNILFKALSCDTVPHFTTIAHFVSSQSQAIHSLFEQVLLICDEQGLLGHELFAIDGCKIRSDASKEWSGTFRELEQKRDKLKHLIRHYLQEHQFKDQWENEEELDRELRRAKTILTLDKAASKIGHFLSNNEPRMGKGKRPKEVKNNITDPESAKMTTSKGTIQGYNGVAAVDKKHHMLELILETIKARYQRFGIHENLYQSGVVVTADTGFVNEANMKYLYENDINGYIPDNQFRSRDPRFKDQKEKYGKRHQIPGKPNPDISCKG